MDRRSMGRHRENIYLRRTDSGVRGCAMSHLLESEPLVGAWPWWPALVTRSGLK